MQTATKLEIGAKVRFKYQGEVYEGVVTEANRLFSKLNPFTGLAEQITKNIEAYSDGWRMPTLAHWACHLNKRHAKALRTQNSGRRDWLGWQAARLASWSEKPLVPR